MAKLYKNQYIIGIYGPEEEGETLLAICDNTREFSEFMEISIYDASTILNKLYNHINNFIKIGHKLCTVAFIKEED